MLSAIVLKARSRPIIGLVRMNLVKVHKRDMASFPYHVFVCGNVRSPGHKRGSCDPDGRQALRDAFRTKLKKAGLDALARANHAGVILWNHVGSCPRESIR
jgi:hypothetical protein